MGFRDLAYRTFVNPFVRRRQRMADAKREAGRHGAPQGSLAKGVLSELVRSEPKDIEELANEMDSDYQVALARQTLAANIASVPVSISVDGVDARASELADRIKQLWDQSLKSMQDAIALGRVAYEKIWEYDAEHNLHVLRKLEPLPFGQTSMLLAGDGSFDGIELKWGEGKDERLTLDPNKSWWLALDPSALEPHGRSRYLGAPKATWLGRRQARENLVKFIRRYVFRGGVGYAPEAYVDENNQPIDPMQDLQNVIENLFSGGSVVLPNTRDKASQEYEYQFTESASTLDPAPLLGVISAEDVEQLRAFGIPEKCVTEGQAVGSFAMVTSQMLILFALVEGLLDQFVASFQRYVIDKSVEVNWSENAPKITISFPSLTKKPGSIIGELITAIIGAQSLNPVVQSLDLRLMLEDAGLPVPKDFEARFQAAQKAALAAASQPAGGIPGGQAQMANVADIGPPLNIPTQAQLTDSALEELTRLYDRFRTALRQQDTATLQQTLNAIRDLQAESRIASHVLGLLSPWLPRLTSIPAGGPHQTKPKDLALVESVPYSPFGGRSQGFRFPFMDDAVDWLLSKRVLSHSDFQMLSDQQKLAVFTASGVNDTALLNQLKLEVGVSLEQGETRDAFTQRVDSLLQGAGISEAQARTIFQTNTKSAYIAGQAAAAQNPAVKSAFGYVLYVATKDTRTRPEHAALDGFVCSVDDPAYAILRRVVQDYGCRCTLIFLDAGQAASRGIKTMSDLPAIVMAKYGGVSLSHRFRLRSRILDLCGGQGGTPGPCPGPGDVRVATTAGPKRKALNGVEMAAKAPRFRGDDPTADAQVADFDHHAFVQQSAAVKPAVVARWQDESRQIADRIAGQPLTPEQSADLDESVADYFGQQAHEAAEKSAVKHFPPIDNFLEEQEDPTQPVKFDAAGYSKAYDDGVAKASKRASGPISAGRRRLLEEHVHYVLKDLGVPIKRS